MATRSSPRLSASRAAGLARILASTQGSLPEPNLYPRLPVRGGIKLDNKPIRVQESDAGMEEKGMPVFSPVSRKKKSIFSNIPFTVLPENKTDESDVAVNLDSKYDKPNDLDCCNRPSTEGTMVLKRSGLDLQVQTLPSADWLLRNGPDVHSEEPQTASCARRFFQWALFNALGLLIIVGIVTFFVSFGQTFQEKYSDLMTKRDKEIYPLMAKVCDVQDSFVVLTPTMKQECREHETFIQNCCKWRAFGDTLNSFGYAAQTATINVAVWFGLFWLFAAFVLIVIVHYMRLSWRDALQFLYHRTVIKTIFESSNTKANSK